MMKKYIYLIALLFVIVSCEKVIDLDLNDANPQLVIVSQLWEGTNDFEVAITETTSYYTPEEPNQVNNAMVTIQEEGGNNVVLENIGDGKYVALDYTASEGKTYTLTVEANGVTNTASSTMLTNVPLDDVASEFVPGMFGQDDGYFVFLSFQDIPVENNYWRIFYKLNGEDQDKGENLFLFEDSSTNGSYLVFPIWTQLFDLGDEVEVTLGHMDESMYEYFLTLDGIAGQSAGQSAAPANPNTNWDNGALGYFGAFNGSTEAITVE